MESGSRADISANIRKMVREGKSIRQAVAIAMPKRKKVKMSDVSDDGTDYTKDGASKEHRAHVLAAHFAGEDIPDEVLDDYPDIRLHRELTDQHWDEIESLGAEDEDEPESVDEGCPACGCSDECHPDCIMACGDDEPDPVKLSQDALDGIVDEVCLRMGVNEDYIREQVRKEVAKKFG